MNKTSITIIPLATSHCHAPYISEQLLRLIKKNTEEKKKTLIFFSRRGNSRARICQDCGYFDRCPNCDIALAYHTSPHSRLVCHQCNYVTHPQIACPNCSGTHFNAVGVGIQKIQESLSFFLGKDFSVGRIDSDTYKNITSLESLVKESNVLLATSLVHFLDISLFGSVVFLCFEINLSVPEYDFEEKLFSEIAYYKKTQCPVFIQSYIPEHPLLDIISTGNFQDFLEYVLHERKTFQYPPFSDFLSIKIHSEQKNRVADMTTRILNKALLLKKDSTVITANTDIFDRYAGEWIQKITFRDTDLEYILSELEVEIVRNRSVSLER